MNIIIIFSALFSIIILDISSCDHCSISNNDFRLDCFPEFGSNKDGCLSRGCCWSTPNKNSFVSSVNVSADVPYCYYPFDYSNYLISSVTLTPRGKKVLLKKQSKSYLPNEVLTLLLEVIYETNSRVRVRITDPNAKRFEVPIKLGNIDPDVPKNPEYLVIIPNDGPLSMEIKRKSDNISIFKIYGPLLYADQFIQISSLMSTNQIYGIGEQNRPFLHNMSNGWARIGLWARDNPIDTNINLYGTHPFYIGMPDNGKAFGTYFFNSNGQEFNLQPAPIITYRTIGGILDMFFFTGGNPEITVSQYLELIGKPMLPPFWALGFHLCKYGYKDLNEISNVFQRNIKAGIPIGTQWADIDYMDKYKDFTVDPNKFNGLGNFVNFIKQNYGARFVLIIDPGIYDQDLQTYKPYTEGLRMNVFIKDKVSNQPLKGVVWPGETVYPDFTHPNSTLYWTKQITTFHSLVPIDGLWIDMNEPSNFRDGSITGCPIDNSYDHPFFIPSIRDNSLIVKTICSSSLHYNNVLHYNLHNLYGYTEAVATNNALHEIKKNERVFILSRSTFSGSGKFTFHWTGDNTANWDNLAHSIRQILNFNMFGISMTGADICGFIGNTTEELCIRWMQLGSFYPFMRNHNALGSMDQDPASFGPKAQSIMQLFLQIRYTFLSYFYTLFAQSHLNGTTVFRPLSFEFYFDRNTHSIDLQFMLGSSLLITPVVTQGARSVTGYFPKGIWYDFMQGNIVRSGNTGGFVNLDAPLEKINIALRGGRIVPLLEPRMTMDELRMSNLALLCGMSHNFTASGELYWDDGISMDSFTGNKFSYLNFSANIDGLYISAQKIFYLDIPMLAHILVFGLNKTTVTSVTLNGASVHFGYTVNPSVLIINTFKQSVVKDIIVKWK